MKSSPNPYVDPAALMVVVNAYGTSDAVERLERKNANDAIRSEKLPRKCNLSDAELAQIGFELVDSSTSDTLFRQFAWPQGWRATSPGQDGRHSLLYDHKDRVRGSMFIKLAGYDNCATVSFDRRYRIERDYNDDKARSYVKDYETGEILFHSQLPHVCDAEYNHPDAKECQAWLKEHFPDTSPIAYWS